MAEVQAERIAGGFILITGVDGVRYAFRQHAVALIRDADECHDDSIVQLHSGHLVRGPSSAAGSFCGRVFRRVVARG